MRRLLAAAAITALAAAQAASAQNAPSRLYAPKVKGLPVDHCAEINAENNCSAAGQAKAALEACAQNGFTAQAGWHWSNTSGTAMHYVTEYDMHAGEVGGRWVLQPTTGTFDWIACTK